MELMTRTSDQLLWIQ